MISGDGRCVHQTKLRHLVYYLALAFGLGATVVGKRTNRDHSTVIFAYESMRRRIAADPELRELVERCTAAIQKRVLAPVAEVVVKGAMASAPDGAKPSFHRADAAEVRDEARKLRRIGWSVKGIAKRLEVTVAIIEKLLDEKRREA
jgi:hypothetical protein